MHILHLTAPLDLTAFNLGVLTPGSWLMHDQNAFEIALIAERGTASVSGVGISHDNISPLLIMRSGAIGDLLFMGPAIASLRAASNREVHLCCRKEHHEIFEYTNLFTSLIDYPLRWPNDYFNVISLENVMELSSDHATDAFAKALGVTVTSYTPIFVLTEEEKVKARLIMNGKRPRLGIQLKASTANRNYPLPQWEQVIVELEKRGWEIFLFGTRGQIPPLPPKLQQLFIHDLSYKGFTFRETAALISQCKAFVGVDSALIHLCHALDIPAIGLYGPFSWESRTAKAPLTRAISGVGECKNCRWHAKNGHQFPPNKPCSQSQVCSVLASITPEKIIAKVDALRP